MCLLLEYECEKSKKCIAAVGLCVARELRCTGVFETCFPQCTSVQCTYCAVHDSQHWYRWPRLCLCTAVVHVVKVKQPLLLLLLPLFFFSSGKLQTTGAERAQRTAASENTRHAGTTHENSKEILSTHTRCKRSIRRHRGMKCAEADATPAITKGLCQIYNTCAANNTLQTLPGSSAARFLTCLRCEYLQRRCVYLHVLSLFVHFFCINRQRFSSFFFEIVHIFCVYPHLFSEVAPRWALLAAVAVTDGKDDNSSDKQWTNCTLQCRCLITLGTHLGRLRHSSICALDALMHSKYRMIKKYAIWITFCI